ncbi:DUF5372 family protein [Nonomuraea sp. NPDC049400]|uniref:DUF5372 family protein n=1 Tax=Nonomuraea sp. NPDC049400 TaxID=3364352 RepID=UPI0037A6D3E1
MTHPFHPLRGKRLRVLFERRLSAGLALSCEGGPLGTIMVPVEWTDRGQDTSEPEATETALSYEALVELAALVAALKGRQQD